METGFRFESPAKIDNSTKYTKYIFLEIIK